MQNKNLWLGAAGVFLGVLLLLFAWQPIAKMRLYLQDSANIHHELSALRDLAIRKARQDGRYKCCIEPPCTMCFWEGNKWNYNVAGTCACDEFIAKREDPCPQCKRGLEEGKCEGKKLINWIMSVCNNFS